MEKALSNLHFRLMAIALRFRYLFKPPGKVLGEVDIKPGATVLDYGCGPGSYTIPAAQSVGPSGKMYALDIHPLASQKIRSIAAKKGLNNIETICSDCATGLAQESIDIALLYDVFHALSNQDDVIAELHRVLKPNALLSFSDHHMQEDEIVSGITGSGLFRLMKKGESTYTFEKL